MPAQSASAVVEVGVGVAELREPAADLLGEVGLERKRSRRIDGAEVDVVDVEQPDELRHRVVVVVDPEIDQNVTAAAVPPVGGDDQHRGTLPAATVAARLVAGGERGEQPPGQAARRRPRRARPAPSPRRRRDR